MDFTSYQTCFDVQESPKLWRQLALSEKNDDEAESPTWLSSHPTHNDRAEKLEGLLPKVKVEGRDDYLKCARYTAGYSNKFEM